MKNWQYNPIIVRKESKRAKRQRRKPYEFPKSVKRKVLERSGGMCEYCRERKGEEFHHITPVAEAIALGLDPNDVRSIENCLLVCHVCHVELDRNS